MKVGAINKSYIISGKLVMNISSLLEEIVRELGSEIIDLIKEGELDKIIETIILQAKNYKLNVLYNQNKISFKGTINTQISF